MDPAETIIVRPSCLRIRRLQIKDGGTAGKADDGEKVAGGTGATQSVRPGTGIVFTVRSRRYNLPFLAFAGCGIYGNGFGLRYGSGKTSEQA